MPSNIPPCIFTKIGDIIIKIQRYFFFQQPSPTFYNNDGLYMESGMGTLTRFGKEVRKLRIERGETMMDMAKKLGKAPSFLSAIETGSKTAPDMIVTSLITEYCLDSSAANRLREAAFESAASFKIKPATHNERELVAAFARKLDSLTTSQRDSILQVLNKK